MISALRLQHFRSYSDASFEFEPGVNIIVGANASGKTNLLEAVLFTCLGSSYRVKDTELLQFDQEWARLDALSSAGPRVVKLQALPNGLQKSYVINDQPLKRLMLQKTLPVVLFEPNHLQLMTGVPDMRREYLDDLLEQTTAGFGALRKNYKRTLAQRNRLLKNGESVGMTQLFAWNIRLSQLGGEIALHRIALVNKIAEKLQDLYRELSGSEAIVDIMYASQCLPDQYSSDMLHKLEQSTAKDFERGFTAYGPHRDDMTISLNGHAITEAASRGETRTMLLALKIIEMQVLEAERAQKPILLLDDVFSELDGARRKALTEVLHGYQAFITTTDADVVVEHFLGNCHVIAIS